MNEPFCLYCDKPLTLLSRISGGGKDFCSREHRELYERERTELGLTRLVQSLGEEPSEPEKGPGALSPGALPMPDPRPAGFLPALAVQAAQGSGTPRPEDTPRWQTVQGRVVGRRAAEPGLQVETRYLTHRMRTAAYDLARDDAGGRIRPVEFPPIEPRIGYLERTMLRRPRGSE